MVGFIYASKIIRRLRSRNWSLSVEVLLYFDNHPKGHFRKDEPFRRSPRCFEVVNETDFFFDLTTYGTMKTLSRL